MLPSALRRQRTPQRLATDADGSIAPSPGTRARQRWGKLKSATIDEFLKDDLENRLGDGNSHGLHSMWRCFAEDGMGSQGLRNGYLDRSAGWAVGNTLVMTVAFALVALPGEMTLRTDVPFAYWTNQLFSAYAFLSLIVSARGIFEISTIQEDIALVPPSLISEYQVAVRALRGHGLRFHGRNLGGGRDGSGCIVWTKTSLRILVSSASFLAYTLHGPIALPWLLLLTSFDSLMQTNVAHRRYRGVLWRNVEAEVWDQEANRQQWPEEFRAWQQGNNFFYMTESGWLFHDENSPDHGWNGDLGRPDWWVPALTSNFLKTLFCVREITHVMNYVFNSDRLRLNLGSYQKVMRLKNLDLPANGSGKGATAAAAANGESPGKNRRVSFGGDMAAAAAAALAMARNGSGSGGGGGEYGELQQSSDLLDLEERALRSDRGLPSTALSTGSGGRFDPSRTLPSAVPLPAPTSSAHSPLLATDSGRSDDSLPDEVRARPAGPKITLSDGRVVSGFRPMGFRRTDSSSRSAPLSATPLEGRVSDSARASEPEHEPIEASRSTASDEMSSSSAYRA